jgi:hypothetical protein
MKARFGILVLWIIFQTTASPETERPSVTQKEAIPEAKQTAERLRQLREASAQAWKAYDQARAEAKRTWKIATEIRERDGILDPAPHRESKPTARSGNTDDLKAYLAANQIYLRANVESAAKGDAATAALRNLMDEERKPLEAARAETERGYKAAAALREKFEIIDRDPESETNPSSASANADELKVYLAAKREHHKAKAERDQFEHQSFYGISSAVSLPELADGKEGR